MNNLEELVRLGEERDGLEVAKATVEQRLAEVNTKLCEVSDKLNQQLAADLMDLVSTEAEPEESEDGYPFQPDEALEDGYPETSAA